MRWSAASSWVWIVGLVAALIASSSFLSSCAAAKKSLTWRWASAEASWGSAYDEDDAEGVVLLSEQRFVFQTVGSAARTEVHYHHVQKLLTEAGLDAMASTVPWTKKGTLLHLDARTISPDGTITAVTDEELFADEAKLGKNDEGDDLVANLRRFTFPRAEVGSILEVSWAFEMPGLYTSWSDMSVLGDLPIRKYRVEIVVDKEAQPDLMVVNHTVPPRLVDERDGMQHLVLELEDLPARTREPYSPSRRSSEPWWMYRTIAYRYPRYSYNVNATWDDVLSPPLSSLLVDGKNREGIKLHDAASCSGSARCLVEKALAHVRENVAWTGHDWPFDFRPPQEIEPSGEATSAEKAALLWVLLDDAGVPVRLAALSRAHTNEIDKTFPHLAWLNHTVVVATVDGQDLWLDPSCEHCAAGELPAWSRDREAVVAFVKNQEVKAEWKRASGKAPAVPDRTQRRYQMRVNEDGVVDVDYAIRTSGADALDDCRGTRSYDDEDWRERAAGNVRKWSLAGVLVGHTPGKCRRSEGVYERGLRARLPSFAARSGDRLFVPLALLDPPVELPRHEPRKSDFVVRDAARWDDELRIVPPPGWTFGPTPAPFEKKAKGASATVETKRDGDVLVIRRVVTLDAGATSKDRVKDLRVVLDAAADLAWRSVTLMRTPVVTAAP